MSLRVRLFLVIVLVNLGVVAAVQFTSYALHSRWLQRHLLVYQTFFQGLLEDAYAPERPDGVPTVRRILQLDRSKFRNYFRDVMMTNGQTVDLPGSVDINPIGAAHRDPDHFPDASIRAGIQEAMDKQILVQAGGGFCLPITAGASVVGGAWFEPFLPPPPRLPAWGFVAPLLAGTLLFGLLLYWSIGIGVVRPLKRLGGAATRVAAGERAVRVPRLGVGRELDVFVDTFNKMAEEIEGHRQELEREVRAATEEAQRKERALLLSSRLASIGTLAAGIAHEINNPIGGMLNAVRRIEKSEHLTERERLYVSLIRDGLERVGGIARRVLDFSPRRIEPVPFQLASAVDGARALVEHRLLREGVELRVACRDDLPQIVGDPHEFQQVLLNLFINSLDVLVGRPEPRWIAVTGKMAEGRLEILVEDNGPGMARADLDRVMDPFFSGKGRPDATGLGMFITYSIIKNHGGEMEIDSDVGRGFRVHLRVPVAGPEPARSGEGQT